MGDDFQPTVEHIAGRRDGATVEVLDTLADRRGRYVTIRMSGSTPVAMQDIVAVVRDTLTEVDPRNAATYRANAARYRSQLQGLDDEYATTLTNCDRNDIVTSHESFGWLARRYGLERHAVAGLSPDEEPSADRIAELTDLADENDVTTIFTEELVSPRIARTLGARSRRLADRDARPVRRVARRGCGRTRLGLHRGHAAQSAHVARGARLPVSRDRYRSGSSHRGVRSSTARRRGSNSASDFDR